MPPPLSVIKTSQSDIQEEKDKTLSLFVAALIYINISGPSAGLVQEAVGATECLDASMCVCACVCVIFQL